MLEARTTLTSKSFGSGTEFSLKRLLHPLAVDFYHSRKRSGCSRVEVVEGRFHELTNGRLAVRNVQLQIGLPLHFGTG